ncbi:MAG: HPr family phosphocarrier protein [Flexistipes sinusarabici]|uniref:HPr family phosphocarrier protein n=1 Tax=Flexistipes sinusarabici TaxID=2352 RepID=A0A5D0MP88_FLESI|nr:HPr family phosphocarrier protein [Flexistipes sinusarabici]TYB33311.1 MAG: HPr family phosphocarrier protein [Flexistipes sinusarabici]
MSDTKLSTDVEIVNELGMHARAAANFVKVANKYSSDVTVEKDGVSANGKSIMGVMMLAASKGSKIKVTTEGEDAKESLEALEKLIKDKFGEAK